ncbi:MAG TPA: MASE1 domain-containing protein [Blastocatellia bacterium]|nr:MASE1 domain-containing protein [Blastocatellia bacterium]
MTRPVKSNDSAKTLEMRPARDGHLLKKAIRRVTPEARDLLHLLIFSTAFYVAYAYGMSFHHISSAPFWPPDAVLLCALLLTQPRRWWMYLLAALPIRLLVSVPIDIQLWFLLAVYANDSLKAIIAAALLRRHNPGAPQPASMRDFTVFCLVAVIGVPILSAFAGAATRSAIGDSYWPAWQRWFLGDALANLLLTPMILNWASGGASAVRSAGIRRRIEGILLIVALIPVGFIASSGAIGGLGDSPALVYLPFPLLLYAAVRFGPRGVSSALSLSAVIIIWNAERGRGPFSAQSPGEDILPLQLFLCVISIPLLYLAVVLNERQRVGELLREDITKRRFAEEALRKSHAQIEDLAGRLIAAQEEERRNIARELHDDLNQQVAALAIGISHLKRQFSDADVAVLEQIVKLRDKTDLLAERIRKVSYELHSSILHHIGLPAALNSYCADFSDREGIVVTLDIHNNVDAVPSDAALCLYRVAQESLRNIARHSGARSAVVTLATTNEAIELRVADKGVGFDPAQARERRGLGLVSMEERVKLLHGRLVLTTQPGYGTELRAQIPFRMERGLNNIHAKLNDARRDRTRT